MLISVVVFFFPLFFCSLTSTECLLPQHAVEAAIIYLGRERQTDDNSSVGEGHEAAERGCRGLPRPQGSFKLSFRHQHLQLYNVERGTRGGERP